MAFMNGTFEIRPVTALVRMVIVYTVSKEEIRELTTKQIALRGS